MALTAKQQRFVEEYLVDLNATQAAIRAGYSAKTAGQIGEENLKKPEIGAAVASRQQTIAAKLEITQEKVLERFYRGETSSAAGSGLGLAIARELAERMGGSLELRSRNGETAFALSLPAEPLPEPVLA